MFVARKQGFTLIEVLVAGTLLLGLVGMLFQVIRPVMRASARTTATVELQSVAGLAMQQVTEDILHTSPNGLSGPFTDTDGSVKFAVHLNDGFSPDGKALWAKQMVVYQWNPATAQLSRTLWPTDPNNTDVSATQAEKLDLSEVDIALRDGATRTLASHVSDFQLQAGGASGVSIPMLVSLRLTKPSGRDDNLKTIELTRRVLPRN